MTDAEWQQIQFFSARENWGDAEKMDLEFVKLLDQFRAALGLPVVIACGTQGQHEENSLHHEGRAVDVVVPKLECLMDAWIAASRLPFTGIGLYPMWRMTGRVCGGLHLEYDELSSKPRKYWIGLGTSKQDMNYYAMNWENMKHYVLRSHA